MVNWLRNAATAEHRAPALEETPQRAVVSLREICVQTADGRTLLSIDALDVCAGDRIVVTGTSGSGKSLLLSVLTGRLPAGLRLAGERRSVVTRIGFVPQRGSEALHPLTKLGRQLRAVTRTSAQAVAAALESVGLGDPAFAGRRPAELSGGQAQRAAVALAMLSDAPLVLADEPTSALDNETREGVVQLLADAFAGDRTLIVTTHDAVVVRALATRHIVVRDGALTELPVTHTPALAL
ncbi:ABC-type glutathione transport system ATPase component [Leucobacter exalbidus]|uniref:ABC-type glutathione transport system ATPase component n=1 Tax=Leucobacter exalbidus TaxID=662960 RepID=A0A940PQ58_9MICO|nr:ATP-binding cassette domain-containing protein [Leucobacter exalbidus]MBP1327115.1 ABC-type glutathione transport system ATPase component [Leucobacter exalbidus]